MNAEEKESLLREHPEYTPLIHYVKGSRRQSGYWRVKPFTYLNPTVNQLVSRRDLAKIAYDSYGKKGFVGDTLAVAYEVRKKMKGKTHRRKGLSPKERELRLKLSRLALTHGVRLRIKVPKLELRV